jgi:superfamily II DNA or RNA helicase
VKPDYRLTRSPLRRGSRDDLHAGMPAIVIVTSYLTLDSDELARREWQKLFQRMRYVDGDQQIHEPWTMLTSGRVRLPRGVWNLLPEHVEYSDRRVCPEFPELKYAGELDTTLEDGRTFERQKDAVKSMLLNEQGLVIRSPGTGKSQIILAFSAVCKTNVLILVHTEDILQQWIEYAGLALPDTEIGVIRGKQENVQQVTIATVQTFGRKLESNPAKWRGKFGAVILDEAHHASAKTFERILNRMHARYRFGVTATLSRADKKHPYMLQVIGPVIHRLAFKSDVPIKVVPLKSGFRYRYRGRWDWGNLVRALIRDEKRNTMIANRADKEIEKGETCLILSRRIEHLQNIAVRMESFSTLGAILATEYEDEKGVKIKVTKEMRKEILRQFRAGEIRCLLATQLADEALDVPRLSRVFLVHPGKAEGRIIQQIGRALRTHVEKRDAIIFDCADDLVRPLRRQWMERKQTYKKLKISVQLRRMK